MQREKIEQILTDELRKQKRLLLDKIKERSEELLTESPDYHNFLKLFGIEKEESILMDKYHNMGRIVFRHLGSILQDTTITLLMHTLGGQKSVKIRNRQGGTPREFIIDWLYEKRAYQIKWRYATTDGTTVNKEIAFANQLGQDKHIPVFLVYYTSLRPQPLSCFHRIANAFLENNGEVYYQGKAWDHIREITKFDLKDFILSLKL